MLSRSFHGFSFDPLTNSDSGDDYIPESKSNTTSESNQKTKAYSRVAKRKKKPKSQSQPTTMPPEAPDSLDKRAVVKGAEHIGQNVTVFNHKNSESPVLSSRTRKEKKEETFKEETGAEDQAPGDLQRLGDGKMLPTRLIQIWTEIDPALPRENIQNIFQSTFAEFRLAAPMGNQPWMQTDDKSGVLALEKARITNGGKIPASWKAAAEQSEHGRKWLEINREQERAELAEALSRVQENVSKTAWDEGVAQGKVKTTAAQYNEMTRQAQNAIDEFKEAAKLAKQAKEAADEASEKADQARLVFLDCSAARDKARLAASSAAAELKVLEEKSQKAAEVEPPSKKRKLGVGHGDAAACDEGWGWGYCK